LELRAPRARRQAVVWALHSFFVRKFRLSRFSTCETELEAFRAAAAFYRSSGRFKGIMTVPTLILIGERDDRGTANACRKMVAGEDDFGFSRQKGEDARVRLIVYPEAYFGV
jgi:hypothetical protein